MREIWLVSHSNVTKGIKESDCVPLLGAYWDDIISSCREQNVTKSTHILDKTLIVRSWSNIVTGNGGDRLNGNLLIELSNIELLVHELYRWIQFCSRNWILHLYIAFDLVRSKVTFLKADCRNMRYSSGQKKVYSSPNMKGEIVPWISVYTLGWCLLTFNIEYTEHRHRIQFKCERRKRNYFNFFYCYLPWRVEPSVQPLSVLMLMSLLGFIKSKLELVPRK